MIKWSINNELAGTWKETVVEQSETVSRNVNGETYLNQDALAVLYPAHRIEGRH
jgi:hypothetical protein